MAASVISVENVAFDTAADPTPLSITIPGTATAVYMCWGYFNGTGNGLSTATINSVSFDEAHEIATDGTNNAGGIAAWYNPSTGSQTLDVSWDAAPSGGAGPGVTIVYVLGGNTTAWRDADSAQGSTNSVTLTTVSGDLVIAFDCKDGGTAPGAMGGSWTSETTQTNGAISTRTSSIEATGATQLVEGQDESFSSLAAISIPAAAGGGPRARAFNGPFGGPV